MEGRCCPSPHTHNKLMYEKKKSNHIPVRETTKLYCCLWIQVSRPPLYKYSACFTGKNRMRGAFITELHTN